jgi:hypothetical protein
MVISINSLNEPVGSIRSWLRSDKSEPPPSKWLICDGSTILDESSPYNGLPLPDMRAQSSHQNFVMIIKVK